LKKRGFEGIIITTKPFPERGGWKKRKRKNMRSRE